MKLAISGLRGLPVETSRIVNDAIRREVSEKAGGGLVGLSCLADGPDSMFARAVLDFGGSLIAVVPAVQYRDGLPEEHHATYDALMAAASESIVLDHEESNSEAHMDASVRMIEAADEMVAVWDGQLARGYGGTADVVSAARERHLPVTVVWPDGATRD